MRISKYSLISILLLFVLFGEISGQASLLVEYRVGTFRPEIKNFDKIYGNDEYLPTIVVGLGSDQGFVVVRYNLYEEWGKSLVTGVKLEGDASWRQEFITIGVRSYDKGRVYIELAYAIGKVEETITTEAPEYTVLNSSWTEQDNRGGAAALGINIPLVMGLQFSGEIGYLYLPVTNKDDKKINTGGRQLSLGLIWAL
ncbi:MAG: hypothetical protein HQ562_00165 [Candidatus Marinimicrobia bacterium]|nr:hypothetical protein [Candidatus Neomarinimicrobiota bacterium]